MLFIGNVGFFVSERRYYLDVEYNFATINIDKVKAEATIKTIKDFTESLPWEG